MGMSDVFVSVGINSRARIEPEDWKALELHGQTERSRHLCPVGLQEDLESFCGGGVEAKQTRAEYLFFLDYCHGFVWGIERSDVWPQGRATLYASVLAREMPCTWTQVKETLYAWTQMMETLSSWTQVKETLYVWIPGMESFYVWEETLMSVFFELG